MLLAGPLSTICQRSWRFREVLLTGSLTMLLYLQKKGMREDRRNYRPVNLASVAEKIMEVIILGTNERYLRNDTVIRNN